MQSCVFDLSTLSVLLSARMCGMFYKHRILEISCVMVHAYIVMQRLVICYSAES